MIPYLGLALALAGAVVAGLALYLLALAIASLAYRPAPPPARTPRHRLVVVVPAHNEERLIAGTVASLLDQQYPRDLTRVVVVADNCDDKTADQAREAGAEVMERTDPEHRGKGYALRWAMDQLERSGEAYDAVVVVDGDSVADRDLLSALERELASGHEVVQAEYSIVPRPGDVRSELIAAACLLFHRVRFSGRAKLGMAANLVGNGMLFSRELLGRHPWSAFTGVEDLEYSMQLRLAGVRPRFAAEGHVRGPVPATRAGDVGQRVRWEGGRFHVVRMYLPRLLRAVFVRRDLTLLDAAIDLATPPLGLLAIVAAAGAAMASAAAALRLAPAWVVVSWMSALAGIAAFVVIGLLGARVPGRTWRALASAPLFIGWKLIAYARMARGFDPARWERSDRPGDNRRDRAQRVEIAGVAVDTLDAAAATDLVASKIGGPRVFQIATINLDFLVRAQRDVSVMRMFRRSDLNIPDGAPVVWLGRLLGAPIPERVAGSDLIYPLLEAAAAKGARVFLLGGEDGVAVAAAARMQEAYPGLLIAGTYEPPRTQVEQMDNEGIVQRLVDTKADILLVALGHPKQERWIDLNRDRLPVSIAIGVGCVFDLLAGRQHRAPAWMRGVGLEWLFRLLQEPRRLAGRYATDAAWLVPLGARTLWARLSRRPAGTAEAA